MIIRNECGGVIAYTALFLLGLLVGGIVVGEVLRNRPVGILPAEAKAVQAGRIIATPLTPLAKDPALRRTPIVIATERVVPAVVSITVTQIQVVRDPFYDDFFGGFFGPGLNTRYREVQSIGSGVVFDSLGHVLTNFHVVEGASVIMVNLPGGGEFKGELVGTDPASDLAVVRVREKGLLYAVLGNSDSLFLGEPVIALGNPFGYLMSDANPSITTGVVSALHRDFSKNPDRPGQTYQDMIQTDAAINPGNSGGPLVNIYGEVIGLNTFIVSPSKGSVGIGFARPINKAKRVAAELIRYGARQRYFTGLRVQDVTPDVARALGVPANVGGVVITQVERNSPASRAGLQPGDIVSGVNNRPVRTSEDIQIEFGEFFAGDVVYLKIARDRGRKETRIALTLEPDRRLR